MPPKTKIFESAEAKALVLRALEEDLGGGQDITTALTVPAGLKARAQLLAREAGVAAGMPLLAMVFTRLDPLSRVKVKVRDGKSFEAGAVLAEVEGRCQALLTGERVALNLLQRLCGVATTTRAYVDAVRFSQAKILDTRKTTPGLRALEKYAATCGGGVSHRPSLSAAVLIKDNHIAAAGGVAKAVALARQYVQGGLPVEVEAENLAQVEQALLAGADIVLLDNMSPALMRQAVLLVRGRALTEASGGITLETVAAAARSGVDRISVGALTHSVRALDISMEISKTWK
jgi:nicotinate-nucleotide pyrophosphorylase (carboxylating)